MLEVTQLVARAGELRREPLERRDRALGAPGEGGGSVAVVRGDGLGRGTRSLRELRHVTQPLALRAQLVLRRRLESLRRLDKCGELGQPRLLGSRIARELVVPPARCGELPPCGAGLAAPAQLVFAAERVEDVQLVRGPREPALLELPGHRQQLLGCGGEVLARHRATPGVGAGPPVREDAPREDEAGLVLGCQLGERPELLGLEEPGRRFELGLDIGLARARPNRGGVALRTEQETEGLREDRLARAGLPRDRVQPRCRSQVGLADEHEVLDAEATKQRFCCSG